MKDDKKKVTFESGGNKSEIDYILVRKEEKSIVKDVTVINGEECLTQHKLLLCKIILNDTIHRKKNVQTMDRCRVWRLKKK